VRLARVFPHRSKGFYVDVGAAHPRYDSVTRYFYDLGWHGINIEPNKTYFAALRRERARDVNINCAVSDRSGRLTLYESGADGNSTLSVAVAQHVREDLGKAVYEREVDVRTLASIFEEFVSDEIDFLKIDTEGHERNVLLGADFQRWRPKIIVVEATSPHTTVRSHQSWESILTDNGYLFAVFDGANRFYVDEPYREWIPVLEEPITILDRWELDRYLRRIEELEERLHRLGLANTPVTPWWGVPKKAYSVIRSEGLRGLRLQMRYRLMHERLRRSARRG
jgi:FkbM family methyltransferase